MKPELSILRQGNQTKGDDMEGHETEAQAAPQDDGLGSVYETPDPDDPISRAIEYCRDHEDDEAAVAVESAIVANIDVIAIRRGEVCVNCDGIEGLGYLDCPIYEPMPASFGGTPEDCFCPFFARGQRTADTDFLNESQDSPEAPAEAISEPISEAVSEAISEPSSGPEIAAEIPRPCARCGSAAHAFYAIPAISETHLCADCVLDLMSTDPTAEEVMQYVTREGDDHPYAARFIYEARKNSGHYSY